MEPTLLTEINEEEKSVTLFSFFTNETTKIYPPAATLEALKFMVTEEEDQNIFINFDSNGGIIG